MPTKQELEQQLEYIERHIVSAAPEHVDRLSEESYWLDQALRSPVPDAVLDRAYALYKQTNGKRGIHAPVKKQTHSVLPIPKEDAIHVKRGETLWGILYREFTNGKHVDDAHIADIFSKLPPAPQTHFIDAAKERIRELITQEKSTAFGIPSVDNLHAEDSINLAPVLRNEEELLHLVEKAHEVAVIKTEIIQKQTEKIIEWLKYHTTEPKTERALEEVIFGPEEAIKLEQWPPEEMRTIVEKAKNDQEVTPTENADLAESLPLYEREIRDRLTISTSGYVRIRDIVIREFLDAIPTDEQKLTLVAKSAVRQGILAVPEDVFWKRVRIAALIRTYTPPKELYFLTIRQFFRSIVEKQ